MPSFWLIVIFFRLFTNNHVYIFSLQMCRDNWTIMMHQGIARVAICFLAKFGFVYFFMTSVVTMFSMYLLVIYFTSTVSDQAGGGNEPVPPPSQDVPQRSILNSSPHLKLASNLKYLQTSLSNSAEETMNYGMDLMAYVKEYSVVPSCNQGSFLNILITSAPRNFRQRSVIRQTWCSNNSTSTVLPSSAGAHFSKHSTIRCIFLLGKSLSVNIQKAVDVESKQHQDILLGTYLDSYRNLTLKVLQGLSWSNQFCRSSYVLKTDDDCFVNVPVLRSVLQSQSSHKNLYAGYVMEDEDKRVVIRDPYSKWQVSPQDYAPRNYPPYASGSGYLLSQDLVEIIISLYPTTYLIPIEDAYIGILLNMVGINPVHSRRFSVHALQWQLCNLMYFVVIHHVSVDTQSQLISQCVQSYVECRTKFNPDFLWN